MSNKILFHLLLFIVLELIYSVVTVLLLDCGIFSIIYFIIIYALVILVYYYVTKNTKLIKKKRDKVFLILITIIASILVLGIISGTIDYIRAVNGKEPVFTIKRLGYTEQRTFLEDEEDSPYSGRYFNATEHYGLGYKLVVCETCKKTVYLMPLWIGSYEWSIGIPVDKLNGRWFYAHNNDVSMYMDGMGTYSITKNNQITEEGTYILNDDLALLKSLDNKKVTNCTIKSNYHELHCDRHNDIFMK